MLNLGTFGRYCPYFGDIAVLPLCVDEFALLCRFLPFYPSSVGVIAVLTLFAWTDLPFCAVFYRFALCRLNLFRFCHFLRWRVCPSVLFFTLLPSSVWGYCGFAILVLRICPAVPEIWVTSSDSCYLLLICVCESSEFLFPWLVRRLNRLEIVSWILILVFVVRFLSYSIIEQYLTRALIKIGSNILLNKSFPRL